MAQRTLSEFCQASDSVSHRIAVDKLKKVTDIISYIFNWVIKVLKDRQQRVCVDMSLLHSCLSIEVCRRALLWELYFKP